MNQLLTMLKWEFLLEFRYKIVYIAMISAILYFILLEALPALNTLFFVTTFLFFDPTLIGFMFVGALVLFEKNENTLQSLTVTPMKIRNYFFTKLISLTVIALVSALLFVFLAHGFEFNYFTLFSGIILASVFLILVGFILVSRCRSINEYLVLMMMIMLLLFIPPILHTSGIYQHDIFYLWPSQAAFTLFQSVFNEIPINEVLYGLAYLVFWIFLSFYCAKKAFYKHIVMGGK